MRQTDSISFMLHVLFLPPKRTPNTLYTINLWRKWKTSIHIHCVDILEVIMWEGCISTTHTISTICMLACINQCHTTGSHDTLIIWRIPPNCPVSFFMNMRMEQTSSGASGTDCMDRKDIKRHTPTRPDIHIRAAKLATWRVSPDLTYEFKYIYRADADNNFR